MDEANSPDWNAIRAEYESGKDSVDGLCQKFHIAKTALYRRRRHENWLPRNRAGGRGKATKGNRRRIMVARFFEALELQMRDIEINLKDAKASGGAPGDTSATSRERDARTLSSLVRTLEKLFELDTGADPAALARKEAAHRDIEGYRQALADRIARLGRQGED